MQHFKHPLQLLLALQQADKEQGSTVKQALQSWLRTRLLPCVHRRYCAEFWRAWLSLIPRKDKDSRGPGSSGLSQPRMYLIDWKFRAIFYFTWLFFSLWLSWICCWALFASENYHLLSQFLDFNKCFAVVATIILVGSSPTSVHLLWSSVKWCRSIYLCPSLLVSSKVQEKS